VPVPQGAAETKAYGEAKKLPPLEEPKTVNDLLLLIQGAIIQKRATLDTTLPSAALFELPKAFPIDFPSTARS